MAVRNLIFNRSAVNVKNGNSFIFFNRSKMLTFNLTVRCGCSYWGGYIHGSEDSRLSVSLVLLVHIHLVVMVICVSSVVSPHSFSRYGYLCL